MKGVIAQGHPEAKAHWFAGYTERLFCMGDPALPRAICGWRTYAISLIEAKEVTCKTCLAVLQKRRPFTSKRPGPKKEKMPDVADYEDRFQLVGDINKK